MTIKKRKLLPRLWEITDPDGRVVVGVLIRSIQERAWLYLEDYHRIVARYGARSWYFNDNGKGHCTVRLDDPLKGRRTTTVARIISGDVPRTAVFYRDGDRLNLRGGNLELRHGGGGVPKRRRTPMASARATLRIDAHAPA